MTRDKKFFTQGMVDSGAMESGLEEGIVLFQKAHKRVPRRTGKRWHEYIPKFFEPKPKVERERGKSIAKSTVKSTVAADRYKQEKELIYSLLPATKAELMQKSGLTNKRLEIALRGTWYVGGVYEVPSKVAEW